MPINPKKKYVGLGRLLFFFVFSENTLFHLNFYFFMTTLHLNNLSPRANEEDMQRVLGKYGKVAAIRMPKDAVTGTFRGILQADFEDETAARRAADELHDTEIMGERVKARVIPAH
jgi:RNA recognition motif-containing protein